MEAQEVGSSRACSSLWTHVRFIVQPRSRASSHSAPRLAVAFCLFASFPNAPVRERGQSKCANRTACWLPARVRRHAAAGLPDTNIARAV